MKPDCCGPDDPVRESQWKHTLEEAANKLKQDPSRAAEREALGNLVRGMDKETQTRDTFMLLWDVGFQLRHGTS